MCTESKDGEKIEPLKIQIIYYNLFHNTLEFLSKNKTLETSQSIVQEKNHRIASV